MNQYARMQKAASVNDACSGESIFGYPTNVTPTTSRFGFLHRNVGGQWYVAPASGTIDTIYWITNGTINGNPGFDSTVLIRVYRSNITPTYGPGVRPGPYPPPCLSWGYLVAQPLTNDPDNGIAAFYDETNDTTWHSTVEQFGGLKPSRPPFGSPGESALWGLSGVPVRLKPRVGAGTINQVPMSITEETFHVNVGDVFFVAMKFQSPVNHPAAALDVRNELAAGEQNTPYPARFWKFYEHDSGPSNCSGRLVNDVKKGWVARGGFVDDTLSTAAMNIWYSMKPETNTPPFINSVNVVHTTVSTDPQTVSAEIFDCDAENAFRAGVSAARLIYRVSPGPGLPFGPRTTVTMDALGDTYLKDIPGQAAGSTVGYKIVANDSTGLISDTAGEFTYRIINFNNDYYRMDTSLACTPANIRLTGVAIDTSKYFENPNEFSADRLPNAHQAATDDGTAGPYDLGGPFVFYGDTMHYAWVGVDGAIALTKTATDTVDLNTNGSGTDNFNFPQNQHHGRADTNSAGRIPKAFIAPYWADWIVADTFHSVFGRILTQNTGGKFIVQWDGVGAFFDVGQGALGQADIDTFRVVLNRSDNSIQFQYDNIGTAGLDTVNLVGMQCDSNYHPVAAGQYPPYNYFNKDRYPEETRVHNGLCVHYIPVVFHRALLTGWNMVSNCSVSPSNSKPYLFPTAVSPNAFSYNGGYVATQTIANGPGVWVKFGSGQELQAPGAFLSTIDPVIAAGWNMIGSVTASVQTSTISTTGAATKGSSFFGYGGSGYTVTTSIDPGQGYWIKSAGAGTMHIAAPAATPGKASPAVNELAGLSRITIDDKSGSRQALYIGAESALQGNISDYELPPSSPQLGFDARFTSGRMVETYPASLDKGQVYQYPIQIQSTSYPVTIHWDLRGTSTQKIVLQSADGKNLAILDGSGKVTLTDAAVKRVVLKLTDGMGIPHEFALSQNYPNPFNPVTRFSVDLPKLSEVDVTVYDLLGQKIATLLTGQQEAGYHTIEWDSKDSHGLTVPSGMYVVRMSAGGSTNEFTGVRKIMLLK
jgi:hypothetical protein